MPSTDAFLIAPAGDVSTCAPQRESPGVLQQTAPGAGALRRDGSRPGQVEGCAVDDVIGGQMARVTVKVGYKNLTCSGPRYHPAMVDPNGGGDLYII